jgi:hypothetical protein
MSKDRSSVCSFVAGSDRHENDELLIHPTLAHAGALDEVSVTPFGESARAALPH